MPAPYERLRKRNDINHVHSAGSSFFTKHLIVKYVKNNLPISRLSIITSTKTHKRAVKRNRLRRVLHGKLHTLPLLSGYDILIITLPACFTSDKKLLQKKEVLASLEFGLLKSKLL